MRVETSCCAIGRSCSEAEKALVNRRLSGVGRTAARCVVGWVAAFGFPAAGLGWVEVIAGFFGVVVEVAVELVVCAHTAGVSARHIPTAATLSFAVAPNFILIY